MTHDTWQYEYTDTFGGEANYSWVKRGTVTVHAGTSPVRAVKQALDLTTTRMVATNYDDTIQLDECGACRVLFITYQEEAP